MRSFSEYLNELYESKYDDYQNYLNDMSNRKNWEWGVYNLNHENHIQVMRRFSIDYYDFATQHKDFLGVVTLSKEQKHGPYVIFRPTQEQKNEFGNDIVQLYSIYHKRYVGVFKIDYIKKKMRELDNDSYLNGEIKWSRPFKPFSLLIFNKI